MSVGPPLRFQLDQRYRRPDQSGVGRTESAGRGLRLMPVRSRLARRVLAGRRMAAAAAPAAVGHFPARVILLGVEPPSKNEALAGLQLVESLIDPPCKLAVLVVSLRVEMRRLAAFVANLLDLLRRDLGVRPGARKLRLVLAPVLAGEQDRTMFLQLGNRQFRLQTIVVLGI